MKIQLKRKTIVRKRGEQERAKQTGISNHICKSWISGRGGSCPKRGGLSHSKLKVLCYSRLGLVREDGDGCL